MPDHDDPQPSISLIGSMGWPLRLAILSVFVALVVFVSASGWQRELSLENVVRHRAVIDAYIGQHYIQAVAIYFGIVLVAIALAFPAALLLSVTAGILFGPFIGPLISIAGKTVAACIVFFIAKTALLESLARRAGPVLKRFAAGFQADAFNYLLFLRLMPIFPFTMVNLAAAFFAVRWRTFIAATALGVTPVAFAYGFVGAGLDSIIAAPAAAYHACLGQGRADCRLNFDLHQAFTWQVLAALAGLATTALIPLFVRRWQAR